MSFDQPEIVRPPAVGFVVHEVLNTPPQPPTVWWAWCTVIEGTPGYGEITFTLDDGITPADAVFPSSGRPKLGPVLFKVWA